MGTLSLLQVTGGETMEEDRELNEKNIIFLGVVNISVFST